MKNRIVFTALALFLGASAAVAGTPANTPTGDWIIGPINAASTSGVGYCSMKNDYRDGNTLVFARDAEGSNSLAIDFHKKILQTGGQYNVTLHLGPLQRQMLAIAATPNVIIIQMGLDRDFFLSLQRRPNLTVDFQTSQMSFRLLGTKDGLQALTSCAQAIGSRRHFAQARVPVKDAAADLAATEPAAGDLPVMPAATFPQAQPHDAILEPVDPSKPVTAGAAFTGNLGEDAVQATLQDQIESLKEENRQLLLENQRVARQMQSDSGPSMAAVPVEPVQSEEVAPGVAPMLPVPPPTKFTGGPAQGSAGNVTAALAAAQAGIQQALEAQQQQEELSRKEADLAAENARLKAALASEKVQAENVRLKAALAAEQQAKQAAEAVAAEAQKQAAIAAENVKLKADLAAAEQERQRAAAAVPQTASPAPAATAAAATELRRQSEINARHAQMVAEAHRALKEAPPETATPSATQPAAQQASAQEARVPLQIVGPPDDFIRQLLTRQHVLGTNDPRTGAYTWNLGGVNGTAEQRELSGGLADAANAYAQDQSQRCRGDFAKNLHPARNAGSAQIVEGELACMNGVSDAATAVLFVARQGKLTIITHQGPPSSMEKALSDRDAMVAALGQ